MTLSLRARFLVSTSPDGLARLDERLPTPNSLRRASEDSKAAVLAASEALSRWHPGPRDRMGVYVGQQRGSLEYCTAFIDSTWRDGPRFASPLYFSESVANNAATHLSLTLGFTGTIATFIGTRSAGLQAVAAAAEDIDAGVTDAGLVVALSFPTPLTGVAYNAVYAPFRRGERVPEFRTLRGSMALLLKREPGAGAGLAFAGSRCAGRSHGRQVKALRSLWQEYRQAHPGAVRVYPSTFCLATGPGLEAMREALGADAKFLIPPETARPEAFALDPFLLLLHSPNGAVPPARAALCLSEEGTAGLLALEGPAA